MGNPMYALVYGSIYAPSTPYTFRISLARSFGGTETTAKLSSPDLALSKDAKISTKVDASASEQ